MADPKASHPEYDPLAGFEMAGGLWFQGFNDQLAPEFYGNYASNMAHFIQDLRKEVQQPKIPFLINVLGTSAFSEDALTYNVAVAQREAARSPELTGTVATADSSSASAMSAQPPCSNSWIKSDSQIGTSGASPRMS